MLEQSVPDIRSHEVAETGIVRTFTVPHLVGRGDEEF